MALRPSCGREPACAGSPVTNTSNRATPLRPVTTLPPSRAGSVTKTYFALCPSASISAREVGLPFASRAELREGVISEIGAALHVVDAGAEGAIAFDPERQPLDEPKRVHGIE